MEKASWNKKNGLEAQNRARSKKINVVLQMRSQGLGRTMFGEMPRKEMEVAVDCKLFI
jgi:hypothetical protein